MTPIDRDGHFVFDHWEILTVADGELTGNVKYEEEEPIKIYPGDDIHVTEHMIQKLRDCLYQNTEEDRSVLTLRAVWTETGDGVPIPYHVQYFLLDSKGSDNAVMIEEHTHTVNEGAMLVTDLYKKVGQKLTLSDSIMAVLEGANDNNKDYTEDANWLVDNDRTTKMIESVSATACTAAIYLYPKTTAVTVKKEWVDDHDTNRPANIEVALYREGVTDALQTATLSAEDNWTHTFENLPEKKGGKDFVYTVAEPTVPEGYTAVVTNVGNLFTITNTKENAEVPTNVGSLTVSKNVTGAGDTTKEFHFTVTLSDTSIDGEYGAMHFENGVATFTLKHGEERTATGIPAGTEYTVTETEANQDGYTTTVTGDASSTITKDSEAKVIFNNHKAETPGGGSGGGSGDTQQTGTLTVEKLVTPGGDQNRYFTFTVTLENSVTDKFGDVDFIDGKATFQLKHGESKKMEGLPRDCRYTVAESDNDGYTVTSTNATGTIGADTQVTFVNTAITSGRPGRPSGKPNPTPPVQPDTEQPGVTPPVQPEQNQPGVTPPVQPEQNQPSVTPPVQPEQNQPGGADATQNAPTAEPAAEADVPQTNDSMKLSLWLTLLGVSGLGILASLAAKRKHLKNNK